MVFSDLNVSFVPSVQNKKFALKADDIEQRSAAGESLQHCPNAERISSRNLQFGIISPWKKSLYGWMLNGIKSDPEMVEKFAEGMNTLIRQILGHSLAISNWAIVTSPKRRHKVRNFASLISARLAELLGIPSTKM